MIYCIHETINHNRCINYRSWIAGWNPSLRRITIRPLSLISGMGWQSGFASANTCLSPLVFVGANHARWSPGPILSFRMHIKKLRRFATDPTIDLWSIDEVHFQQHGSRCLMWVPPEEKDPILLHHPTRKSVGYFGAVRLRDGKLVFQREDGKFSMCLSNASGRPVLEAGDVLLWLSTMPNTIMPISMLIGETSKRLTSF